MKKIEKLKQAVVTGLHGVGDHRLGEWAQIGTRALHLRRRLSADEQKLIGDVVDIRGTAEAVARLDIVRHLLPLGWTE